MLLATVTGRAMACGFNWRQITTFFCDSQLERRASHSRRGALVRPDIINSVNELRCLDSNYFGVKQQLIGRGDFLTVPMRSREAAKLSPCLIQLQ